MVWGMAFPTSRFCDLDCPHGRHFNFESYDTSPCQIRVHKGYNLSSRLHLVHRHSSKTYHVLWRSYDKAQPTTSTYFQSCNLHYTSSLLIPFYDTTLLRFNLGILYLSNSLQSLRYSDFLSISFNVSRRGFVGTNARIVAK